MTKQKVWSSQDVELSPAAHAGDESSRESGDALDDLLQAAMAVAGGEGSGGTCSIGVPPWFSRSA